MVRGLLAAVAATLAFAGNGEAKWVQWRGNPVLKPTLAWEQRAVGEPTVIWDRGRYRMWYTGGWTYGSLGYAESQDGVHWRKRSKPLLRDALRNEVVRTRWGFLIYTVDHSGDLQVSTSLDGIHLHRYVRPALAPQPGTWDDGPLANSYAWQDGKRWHLLYESMTPSGKWEIGLASGKPGAWQHASGPLALGIGGMWGGPWLDGRCLYFHASMSGLTPTNIYRRCTSDFVHWSAAAFILGRTQPWEVDQVADPSIARAPGRRPLMAFSGVDNPRAESAIGVAWLR